jgi:hypothetical protein
MLVSEQPLGSREQHQCDSGQHTKAAKVGKTHVNAQQLREVRHCERPLRMSLRDVSVPPSVNGALNYVLRAIGAAANPAPILSHGGALKGHQPK